MWTWYSHTQWWQEFDIITIQIDFTLKYLCKWQKFVAVASATVFFNHWHLNANMSEYGCTMCVCVLWLLFRMKYKCNILFPAFEYLLSVLSFISSQQCVTKCHTRMRIAHTVCHTQHNVTGIMNFLVAIILIVQNTILALFIYNIKFVS